MLTAEWVSAVATVVTGLAVLLGTLTVLVTRSPRTGLAVFLDLLLAAGLLRLAVADSWRSIGTAAVVVAIRKVAARRSPTA